MRFSLGRHDGDAEERPELANGNGNRNGAGGHLPAPASGDGPRATGASEAARVPLNHGADRPAPLADPPTLIGGRPDVVGSEAPTTVNGSGANGSGGAATGSRNGRATGNGSDPRAHAAPEPDGYEQHLPLGEGPTMFSGDRPPAAGIAVPGAGSSPQKTSTSGDAVVAELPPRPEPPPGATEEEYKWHTYKVYPSGKPDAVEFIDLYKAFGKNRILRGLNMGLPEGMVSMILGPSGTGKSVCIKHMVGLLYPDQGDILVHGRSVPNMVDDELFDMRKKFGLLFQDGALFGSMDLYDNVAFPLRQHTEKGEDEIENTVMRRLNEVGLGHSRDKFPNELSGGMRKRAGFARALVLEPDIVLFDEPDSGLDPVRTSLLGELILEVHRDMMDDAKAQKKEHLPTFCVITHNVMMARRTADYINVLWKGRVVEAGPTEDMLNSPNPFIRQFLAGESMGPLTMD
jgi:phospholipid/cholesterol/gamma-HCH transport system ATP-binding protein